MGGLGNQLFQYAVGRQAAVDHTTDLLIDTRWFKTQSLRRYSLDDYPINIRTANIFELEPFAQTFPGLTWRWILQQTQWSSPKLDYLVVSELSPSYHPDMLKQPGHLYLQGYFQTEQYFNRIASEIRNTIKPIQEPDTQNRKYLDLIESTQSVSLHVRRGDYVKNLKTNQFHGTCSIEYYLQAIKLIVEQINSPSFFVFSDEPDWVKNNLNIPFATFILRQNNIYRASEDLRLMSHCKHHIIANSSFSWWGAWLSENPDKIVIAPNKWFASPNKLSDGRIPATWIQL